MIPLMRLKKAKNFCERGRLAYKNFKVNKAPIPEEFEDILIQYNRVLGKIVITDRELLKYERGVIDKLNEVLEEKENPENFDDGTTHIAPNGQFKSGEKEVKNEIA